MTGPAVIFDMDGTLLDTERVCLECFVAVRRHHGLVDGAEVFLSCVGQSGAVSRDIIAASLETVSYDIFAADLDRAIQTSLAAHVPVKSGVRELLALLAARGARMAVATSTETGRARHHLEAAGLLGHFEHVIGGDMVARKKPDPEIYHMAAARLGLDAGDCFAFEDSEPGTLAAVASGARVVQVPDLGPVSAALRALGHVIADDLHAGARRIGLL